MRMNVLTPSPVSHLSLVAWTGRRYPRHAREDADAARAAQGPRAPRLQHQGLLRYGLALAVAGCGDSFVASGRKWACVLWTNHFFRCVCAFVDPGDGLEIGTGTTLITSSHDRTVRVWVIDGGDESFSPEEASVDALAAGRNTQVSAGGGGGCAWIV